MKILDIEQGSLEWHLARLGIPTASRFDRILTPKTMKPAAARSTLRAELTAEWILGQPIEMASSGFMERGKELEPEARGFYAFEKGVKVQTVGFIVRDDDMVGCSPDGLVGDDGGLEIKCPGAVQHMKYLLGLDDLAASHRGQLQGSLYLTGRDWWDIVSFNPDLPAVIERVEPDPDYFAAIGPLLDELVGQLLEDRRRFAEYRIERPWDMEAA